MQRLLAHKGRELSAAWGLRARGKVVVNGRWWLDRDFSLSEAQQETLKKAALALPQAFIGGLRQSVEDDFASIGQPLSEEERLLLKSRAL